MEHEPGTDGQEEIRVISTTLGQTLEEWAEERRIERGQLTNSRRLLRRFLENRFGPLPDELRQRIDETTDLARLEEAFLQSPSLRSLDELEL
ncbi:MAG: hypothetical protein FJ276_37730 [Planctomycetes bacterium]|nr:hypothetical protein [Planctomycetota bacterium]